MATEHWLCCFPNEARAKMGLPMVDKLEVTGEKHYCPMTRKLEFGSFRGFQVRVWNAAKAHIARLSTSGLLFKLAVVQVQPPGLNARSELPVFREVDDSDRRLGQNAAPSREQASEKERERHVKEVFARMVRNMDRGGSSTDTDVGSSSGQGRTAYCQAWGKDVMNGAERSEVRETCAKSGHLIQLCSIFVTNLIKFWPNLYRYKIMWLKIYM